MIECNREEAIRATEVAVMMMKNRDFLGAEKILLKAQKLFPELENISKLLTICNVHCAAELRVNGEMDLYRILQVEEGAGEALIKKQYRKLVLSLHPDKNCFAGAEAAFKLVAEAYSVLWDPTKRSQYDLKRKNGFGNVPKPAKQQPSKRTDSNKRSRPGSGETFWTICSHCNMRYQYYTNILNTMARCLNCKMNFFAYNLNERPMPTSSSVPHGSQIPAYMFPNKQHGTHSQHGHPLRPSCAGSSTNVKPNGSQDPLHMFPNQQHGVPCQNAHPVKPSVGVNTDLKRTNVAQHDEYMKGYSRPGCDENTNHPDTSRGKFQYSTPNQDKSSVPTEDGNMHARSETKNGNMKKLVREDASAEPDAMNVPCSAKLSSAAGKPDGDPSINIAGRRSMRDHVDPNTNDRRNLAREDASTVPSAAGSSGTRRSGRRKQDADANIFLNIGTKKRQRKNDLPPDVVPSDPPQVSGNISIEEKAKITDTGDHGNIKEEDPETDTCDQDNIMEEDPETVSEKKHSYSELVSFPDPDFFNFEKFRDINLFAVGQIWALYDNFDGMPRYYARIKQFDASNFKVHLTWLEYNAMDEAEENWVSEDLPTACGNFCLQKGTDITDDRSMFSHIAECTRGKKKNSYAIYPNKGEVWALYKGWNIEWSSDADNHRSYEYEVVEVLSNMSVNDGATVIPLVRIKGFVSLFATAKDKSSFVIPSSELLRFSHSIPFYRTNGNEKVGVPGGLLELDNACLPADLDAAFSSVTLDSYMSIGKKESSTFVDMTTDNTSHGTVPGDEKIAQKENHSEAHACQPMSTDAHKDMSPEQNTTSKKTASEYLPCDLSPNVYTYPDSDFHSFEEGRSCERFMSGQVWALYSDVDKFPKYYGWIRKVEKEPFKVYLVWLEACPEHEQEKQWFEQDIPISCGTFRIRKWKVTYETNDTFSHLVDARETGTKWELQIVPQPGAIWAVYQNWAPDWVPTSAAACEFAVCQVVNRTEASTTLIFMSQVSGYRSVFRPDKKRGVLEIPTAHRMRFSHRIPSCCLTVQQGGKLLGCYELDPASVPDAFLYRDT